MDFEITSSLDTIRNQQITANFEAVSAWLDTELKPYVGMVVTEEIIPTAKTYRANLRKVKDRIEQFRKEAKSAALAPYTAFENQCKVLTGKIDAAVVNIDEQVKAYEETEKEEKIKALHGVYDKLIDAETQAYCPWEFVFTERWGNKTYLFDTAAAEIKSAIENTKADIETIRGLSVEDTPYLLDYYRQTHNIGLTVRKAGEIATMRQREEQRRKENAERVEKPVVKKPAEDSTEEEQPERITVTFRVSCTMNQLAELGQYMREHNISYGRA